jgi:hypothetical protein
LSRSPSLCKVDERKSLDLIRIQVLKAQSNLKFLVVWSLSIFLGGNWSDWWWSNWGPCVHVQELMVSWFGRVQSVSHRAVWTNVLALHRVVRVVVLLWLIESIRERILERSSCVLKTVVVDLVWLWCLVNYWLGLWLWLVVLVGW